MRLLVDQNLARRVAVSLHAAGHDAVHVSDRGLADAEDDEIVELAISERRTIVSEDTDFGALLIAAGERAPSYVLLRSAQPLTPDDQVELLLANLPAVEADLTQGAIVVFGRGRVRVRPLPFERSE